MQTSTSTASYRVLLKDAWRISMRHRSLWIFGLLASLINSGGIIDVALRSGARLQTSSSFFEHLLDGTFVGFGLMREYLTLLQKFDPTLLSAGISIVLLALIALVFALVLSQGALIAGTTADGKTVRLKATLSRALASWWDVAIILVLSRASITFLLLISAIPTLMGQNIILLSALIVCVVCIQIITMLSLVETIIHRHHALWAIRQAFAIFFRQGLATFELGILLFLVYIGCITLIASAYYLLSVPAGILLLAATVAGNQFLINATNVFVFFIMLVLIGITTGWLATFQTRVWVQFAHHTKHANLHNVSLAKTVRFIKQFARA